MDGWIKIHRIFEDWEWYDDSHMVHLYLHLIIKANTKTARWRGMTVKRGQLITSRAKLAAETNMSERNIRTCISRLAKTGEITVKTTSHYSIITISKYESYQSEDTQCDQQNDQQTTSRTTNKRPASDQQATSKRPQTRKIRKIIIYLKRLKPLCQLKLTQQVQTQGRTRVRGRQARQRR